ncbi:MAG: histone deacetylase [Myxococcales bacterium]|nr:histone deacetylase [Myxococcales bacterium]
MIPLFYSPRFFADIGDHIMPIDKYRLVAQALAQRAADDGLPVELREPGPASDEDILRVHDERYLRAVQSGEPRELAESQKFPWSPGLAEAVRFTNGACIAAVDAALEGDVAGCLASGFHHAHRDHGEGFCTFNGLVIALARAQARGALGRALIVDLDLHYGNGTAALLSELDEIFAVSVYGCWYQHNRSTPDIDSTRAEDTHNCASFAVANGSGAETYLAVVERALAEAFERARPELVLYHDGADPLRDDPYSPLDLGVDDLRARDALVFEAARAAGARCAWALGGGYSEDISQVVAVHVNTAVTACEVFR